VDCKRKEKKKQKKKRKVVVVIVIVIVVLLYLRNTHYLSCNWGPSYFILSRVIGLI